jgi:hypothetical protein
MRKLVPLQQLIDEAREQGLEDSVMLVDPDDVCTVNPDELELEENPDDDEE